MDIIGVLCSELKLNKGYVKNVIELIDEGNTIPFIARYRKEQTGSMTDVELRDLFNRLTYLRNLQSKKEEVIRLIDEQGKLTLELKEEILKSESLQRVDDLYRPFRPKRRTRATMAKEKGLEDLAKAIFAQEMGKDEFIEYAKTFLSEEREVNSIEDAINGAMDIIAEDIADDPDIRRLVKNHIKKNV